MFNKSTRYIAVFVCALIFFVKMGISITPIFSSLLDKHTVLQIVLQLEIENNNGGHGDISETSSKFFNTKNEEPFYYGTTVTEDNEKVKLYLKNEKSIKAYHPSVPTPPPNA